MKSTELRIGNYIQVNNGSNYTGIGTVATMSNTGEENDVAYYDDNGLYEYTDLRLFEPIPLTEDWLLKFGFEREKTDNYMYKIIEDETRFAVYLNGDFMLGYSYEWGGKDKCLKHVHQLQNLYFALTGEELTIKEEIGTTT